MRINLSFLLLCTIACSSHAQKSSNQLTAEEQKALTESAAKNELTIRDLKPLMKWLDFPNGLQGLIVVKEGSELVKLNTFKLLTKMKGNYYPFSIPNNVAPLKFKIYRKQQPKEVDCWLVAVVTLDENRQIPGFVVIRNIRRESWWFFTAHTIVKDHDIVSPDEWKEAIEKAIDGSPAWSSYMGTANSGTKRDQVQSTIKEKLTNDAIWPTIKELSDSKDAISCLIVVKHGRMLIPFKALPEYKETQGNRINVSLPKSVEPLKILIHFEDSHQNYEYWLVPLIIFNKPNSIHGFIVFENSEDQTWFPYPSLTITEGNLKMPSSLWKESINSAINNDLEWQTFWFDTK